MSGAVHKPNGGKDLKMIVDLAEKTESGTFELKGGGKVHLRLLTGEDLKAMRKACLSTAVEYPLLDGKYQRFETEKFDAELFRQMGWDRNIVGWDDLYDRNEKPIPVTPENKALLMERVPEFKEAVENGNKALRDREKAETEAAEKNLQMPQLG